MISHETRLQIWPWYVIEFDSGRHPRLQYLDERLWQRIDHVNDGGELSHEMYSLQQVDHGLREGSPEIRLVDEIVGSFEQIAHDDV